MRTRHSAPTLCSLGAVCAAVIAVAAAVAVGQAPAPTGTPATAPATMPVVDQTGPTIKDTYAKHFLIGTAGDIPGNYSDVETALIKQNFGIVTPENCMKP